MRRPAWHDVVLALGVVGILALGVWAMWGQDLREWVSPAKPVPAVVPPAGGMT